MSSNVELTDGEILQIVMGLQQQRMSLIQMTSMIQKHPHASGLAEDTRRGLATIDELMPKLAAAYTGPWNLYKLLSGTGA